MYRVPRLSSTSCFAFAVLYLMCSVDLAAQVEDRPDHEILVHMEASAPGASLFAPGAPGEDAIEIAQLPTVLHVGLKWGRRWGFPRWPLLSVTSAGDIAQATYEPTSGVWRIELRGEVRAPGCTTEPIVQELCAFERPSELDWDRIDGIPERLRMRVDLTANAQVPIQAVQDTPPPTLRLMVESSEQNAGRLELFPPAGRASSTLVRGGQRLPLPVALLTTAGVHRLAFRCAATGASFDREVMVPQGGTVRVEISN